jgi:hypothetical protein
MKNFLVLFREPDGRTNKHTDEEIKLHRKRWEKWLSQWKTEGKFTGGGGLTLNGRLIKGKDVRVTNEIHQTGTEIVGGYLLIKANDLDEAAKIIRNCPIYEFDGYAEIREVQP